MNVAGKRALVTGASKGLGAAVAQRLAAAGADVAIHYHSDRDGADATAAAVRAEGREPLLLRADLADPDAAAMMADQLEQAWGSLDFLVNNAGVAPVHPWDSITPDEWQHTLAVNLHGPFYALRFALPLLRKAKEGAAVVNISSVVSLNGGSFGPAYAAAKAGLDGLTRSAARDLGPLGIRVNSVLPGPIDSPLLSALPEAALQAMAAQTPLRRMGTFGEVAELVAWLLSPGAAYINGQMIIIDGGRVMH